MQNLQFEVTWDKTLSNMDRDLITQVYNKQKVLSNTISCDLIRSARNYKNDFLVTVLIHNATATEQTFIERAVSLQTEQGQYRQRFTQPKLVIPSYSSMPWTFIFKQVELDAGDVLTVVIH